MLGSFSSVNGGLNKEGSIAKEGATVAKDGLIVELGAGSLAKTKHLLRALSKLIGPTTGFESIEYKAVSHFLLIYNLRPPSLYLF